MGFNRAYEMRLFAGDEAALKDHMENNCYPPIPSKYYDAFMRAIELVREGKGDTKYTLPDHREFTAAEIIKMGHLEAFLEPLEGEGIETLDDEDS